MKATTLNKWLDNQEESLLLLAALFEGEFSIDWVQSLSGTKATPIMKVFDHFQSGGVLP